MNPAATRAAQYLRMSTEHQNYSLEHQGAAIAAHAAARGFEIVRTYADPGVSGLTLKRRKGLQGLLADVLEGAVDFGVILVLDVSRWGRFQDPDESAHYEFICRQAGVRVEYCAEPFEDDGSLAAALVKQLKRTMAAQYSRDLSGRIAAVQRRLGAKGFWQGGPCGYGFRREAASRDGGRAMRLEAGQQKAIRGDRTRLVAGPPEEVATVRRIYRLFALTGLKPYAIAALLNAEGVPAEAGALWTTARVRQVLGNEKYAGVLVFGRRRQTLDDRRRVPPEDWVRAEGACPALVDPALFARARQLLRKHHVKASDEALLANLRDLLARHGRLSCGLLQDDPASHCPDVYRRRFGDLTTAFQLAGYLPSPRQLRAAECARRYRPHALRAARKAPTDLEMIEGLKRVLAREGRLSVEIIAAAADVPHPEVYRRRFGGMRRAYALAGYQPNPHQDRMMDALGGQTISRGEARLLAAQAGEPSQAPAAAPGVAPSPDLL